ncbi:hypothetical protein N7478_004730 [Penicillium angulare]|uniref:uncharacterized protein n=1 Tax=Penicillium angulare TaxID=116970 RepID=UPI002541350F|nr:uncharacterized protein N7478_004730 [Penicillium angulare]KAJ5279358.1 hypothetical protein N7478_004730 [Penicillium angulare]
MPFGSEGKRPDSPCDNTPTKKRVNDLRVERVPGEFEGLGSFLIGDLQLVWKAQEHITSAQEDIGRSIRREILSALQNRVHKILPRRVLERQRLEQQQAEQYRAGQHCLHLPHQTSPTVQISITSACGKFTQGYSPDATAILHKYSSSDENNSNEQTSV